MKPEFVFGLENAVWPAVLVSAGGDVLLTNTAAKTVFGAALGGDSANLAAVWSPENSGSVADFLARWEKSPEACGLLKFKTSLTAAAPFLTSICVFHHDGKKRFVLQLLPQPAPAAPANGATDAALQQKLERMLQLARTVSLDFNNALTGVLAHTSLLLGKTEPEHPWRRALLEMEKSAQRAAEIAGELGQFSRSEKEVRRVPAGNLNSVVTRCVESFKSVHGDRFEWKLTLMPGLFAARYEEAQLQQVLVKILENAVESFGAGNSGQVAVPVRDQISIQTRNVELTEATQDRGVRLAAGTYVCVEISDNGSGIDAESLPRIFEPFFTTKRPPHRGLGLALVYGILTNHGGGVAISSSPGKGTSARIYLPAEARSVDENLGFNGEMRGTGTVLVVDDENMVLRIAETILTDFGYRVLTAGSGLRALDILNQAGTRVNLVITDLVMPGMGGRELMERIRKLDPDLPVMCTSGYVLPADQRPAAGFLQKPFTSTDLLLKVKSALAGGMGS